MSHIDDLMAKYCPRGVRHATLAEMGTLFNGLTGKSKADFADGNARFVSYVNVFSNIETNVAPNDFVQVGDRERQNRIHYGDILFTASSESAAEVGMSSGVTSEPTEPLYLNSFCFGFRPNDVDDLDPAFAKHLFRSERARQQIIRTANGVTRINISKERFREIKIPVLPPAVQREIASILDKMECLQAELEAELDYRSRQYAYYRDSLLTGSETDRVTWARLGDVGRFFRGKRFTKADYVDDGIPAIHYGEIYTQYGTATAAVVSQLRPELRQSLRFASPGDVVLVDVGETVEDVGKAVAWLGSEDVAVHDHCYVFRHEMNPSFVSYYMQTARFHTEKAKHVARTKVKTLLMDGLAKVSIPVPPLEEQERIVGILDKLDALVNDLSIGLPAEIRARRTQYEYYRDKLLTFEERVA